jgi:hypothetical protein
MTTNHVDETRNPCPCRGCTTSRQEERERIIFNLKKYIESHDVGLNPVNFAYNNVVSLLEQKII